MRLFFQLLVFCVFLLPFGVNAQTIYKTEHSKTSIQVLMDKVKVGKNRKGTVKFTIIPNKDWYVYSIKEENGMPITVESSNEELFTIGKLSESPKPTVDYDEGFEVNVYKHFTPVTITVPIHFSKKANIKSVKNIRLLVGFQTPSIVSGVCISDEQHIMIQIIPSK